MSLMSRIQAVVEHIATIVKGKQDKLVSGANIKTINGTSLLGSGNIDIASGGSAPLVSAEIDFGLNWTRGKTFTIDDGRILPESIIHARIGGITGKPDDELECANISVVCKTRIDGGRFIAYVSSTEYINGIYTLYYTIN